MNKKIYLISIILSLFLSISSTNAWRDCNNAGTCTECNPDILTHCEPLNSNTNTCVNPDTPWCAPTTTHNPYSWSNTSTPTKNTDTSNKKTAYLNFPLKSRVK